MTSWKKIHEWFVKALEEPFFRAEMHRVDMYLPDSKEPQLQVIRGGKNNKEIKNSVNLEKAENIIART